MTTSENTQRDELTKLISSRHTMAAADAILAAGYRKPRTITTVEELDALPVEAVVRSDMGNVYIKDHDLDNPTDTWWVAGGGVSEYQSNRILLPATVLHAPDAGAAA